MSDPPLSVPPVSKLKKLKSPFLQCDYKKPLKNDSHEALATQLYETLNPMGGSEFQKLSRATARRLATTYDAALLLTTLATLKHRATTRIIRNPVGFFITLISSTKHARI